MPAPTEKSYLWTTGGAGDGSSTYTRADWSNILQIVAACQDSEGVGIGWLNKLAATVGTNTVTIDTGVAIVDGKPYICSTGGDISIPSPSTYNRIDRIVLRCDWTAQTVRLTRIAGTEAASPTPPSVSRNRGSLFDLYLYQALITPAGAITLTDEREWARVETDYIADNAITDAKLRDSAGLSVIGRASSSSGDPADIVASTDGAVLRRSGSSLGFGLIGAANIADNAITDAKLRDSAGLSVIGRASSSSGDPADIVASTDGYVLRRSGSTLGFGQVSTSGIANDAVDDTKVGARVPQLYRRQGGDSTNWNTGGTTNYTPGAVRMQCGARAMSLNAGAASSFSVTFPVAFSGEPIVLCGVEPTSQYVSSPNFIAFATEITTTGCYIGVYNGASYPMIFNVFWLAIGPE